VLSFRSAANQALLLPQNARIQHLNERIAAKRASSIREGTGMKFEDFAAETGIDNTIILWANEPPLRRVRFSIGALVLTDQIGVENPVHHNASIERCRAQRDKIEAACRRAFEKQPTDVVSLVDADFEEVSPTD
jgi:hypothetical protein